MIRAFDYVVDRDAWTYVVRGSLPESNMLVGKVIYPPPSSLSRKCKDGLPRVGGGPTATKWELGGPTDFILGPRDLVRVLPRDQIPVRISHNAPTVVRRIDQFVRGLGGEALLHGSRRLGLQNRDSDWDLLLSSPVPPGRLILDIVNSLGGQVWKYSYNACFERASRYARLSTLSSIQCLTRIFLDSTLYLRTRRSEIGIFFIHDRDSSLPDLTRAASAEPRDLSGEILPSEGGSHLMPRTIQFLEDQLGPVTIATVLWELAGLEELAGQRVMLNGARRVSESMWWLGGRMASIDLLKCSEWAHGHHERRERSV